MVQYASVVIYRQLLAGILGLSRHGRIRDHHYPTAMATYRRTIFTLDGIMLQQFEEYFGTLN